MNTTNWLAQGHLLRGPVADLVALKDSDGNPHTGVLFPEDWCDHKALHTIPPPGSTGNVTGVAPLIDADLGALVYAGGGRTVHELAAILRDEEEDFGLKGTLELAIELVSIIQAAHKAGLGPHRGMTPWRIIVAPNGAVSILGWGLRQLDMEDFLEDEEAEPSPDSLRYCPPERMEDAEEDESTDRYTALLIAIEVWLGEPIYNGVLQDILPQIEDGKASQLLPEMPESADLAFATALGSYPEDRHDSADACLSDLRAALKEATGPSLAELVEMADGFASPREVTLSATWQWPDGEPEGESEAAPAAAKTAPAAASVPDEVRPWLEAANEAANRAEKAAERAGQAADEATDQALRTAEGVEAALDAADEAADTALDEAERARNAATACESCTDEATATTHAETAKQAATRAEDAASDARVAADKALDCSKAHLQEQRKELEARLESLQATVDGWDSPAAPTLQFADAEGVQEAVAAAEEVRQRLEASEQRAEDALHEAKECDTSEAAAEHIEAFEKANAERSDELVALNRAYEKAADADRETGKGFLNEAGDQLDSVEAAVAEHLQANRTTEHVPDSLADKQQAQAGAEEATQASLKAAREALADKRADDVLRLVGEANAHLEKAAAARSEFEDALEAWNAHQLDMLEQTANTCREQFNAWETLPNDAGEAPDDLAEVHSAVAAALQALHETTERARTSVATLCSADRSVADRREAAAQFESLVEQHQAQTAQWVEARAALQTAQEEREQHAAVETLRTTLQTQLLAAMQSATERLEAIQHVDAGEDATQAVSESIVHLQQAVADAQASLETARQTSDQIAGANAEGLAQQQDNLASVCATITEAVAAAQAAEQRVHGAMNEAAEEHARRLEALQQQVTALLGTAQQIEATRQSTFEAARATTRPAGPKMAMAWDAVEEVNETISETLASTLKALQDAPATVPDLERLTATAQEGLDSATASIHEMTQRVTALEEAARSALEEAERVGAARQAAEALAVETQGLQSPESASTEDVDTHADVIAALEAFNAAAQALAAGRQAANEAIQAVSEVVDAAEAEARLETAREQVSAARSLTDAARDAAQSLASAVDHVRAQQRQLEASRGVLSETKARVQALVERAAAPLEIPAWSNLAEAISEHQTASSEAHTALQGLLEEIDGLLEQDNVDSARIGTLTESVGRAEESVRAGDERRERLAQQGAACLEQRQTLCSQIAQTSEQANAKGTDLEASRALWQQHFGASDSTSEQATALGGQLDEAEQQLQGLNEALSSLQNVANESLELDVVAESLQQLETRLNAITLPQSTDIAAVAASAQHAELVERVEAALDEAIAQVPPFDALDIMIDQIAPGSVTAETLDVLHAARDAARAAGQAVTRFEIPEDEAALTGAPEALQGLTTQCLEAFQIATDACSAAREESETRTQRADAVQQGLDAVRVDTPWDTALDQIAVEAQTHLPDQAASLQETLDRTREAHGVVAYAPDALPQGLEEREAYLVQAQAAAEVYQSGLATLTEAMESLAAAQQAAQEAFAADTASLAEAMAAFDTVFSGWSAPESTDADDALPEGLSGGWSTWCEAYAAANGSREAAQTAANERAAGTASAPVQDVIASLEASLQPAGEAQSNVQAAFVEAAETLSAQARTIVLPDVMPLLENASEELQAATAEMQSQRAAADTTKATLEQTLNELRITPTPALWAVLAQCSTDLTAARDLLNTAKENVDKAFREGASPTQRLQRRQMRLERLRIQREEERKVAEAEQAAATQAAAASVTDTPSTDEAAGETVEAAPAMDARPRRRRRPEGDAVAAPEDGMRRRRRRRREGDDGATASGEPRRRRRRREGDEPAAASPAGSVDRSSRMERLRARRARQREADANMDVGAAAAPAVAEPPRRRRRRRPEGAEGATEDGAPRRQRRRRRRETEDNPASSAGSQADVPPTEDP